jgi:hypothetical protein
MADGLLTPSFLELVAEFKQQHDYPFRFAFVDFLWMTISHGLVPFNRLNREFRLATIDALTAGKTQTVARPALN